MLIKAVLVIVVLLAIFYLWRTQIQPRLGTKYTKYLDDPNNKE